VRTPQDLPSCGAGSPILRLSIPEGTALALARIEVHLVHSPCHGRKLGLRDAVTIITVVAP
jgi:hypothetical protein